MPDLKDKLQGLTGAAGAAGPATITGAHEAKSEEFSEEAKSKKSEIPVDANGIPYIKDSVTKEYRPRTEEEVKKYQEAQERRQAQDSVSRKFRAQSEQRVTELERNVRELIASKLRIIGYVVAKGDKIDFAAKSKTNSDGTKDYEVSLKNSAPSSIKYAVVKEPTALLLFKDTLSSLDAANATNQYMKYKNASDDIAYAIKYIPWDEMVSYVMANTNGSIYEDENIFTQYVKGKGENAKVYSTSDAIKSRNGVPAGSCLYLSVKLAPVKMKSVKDAEGKETSAKTMDLQSVVTLKHSIRSKIITPANIIPLKKFQTITPQNVYAPEDATRMINLYLGKFNTSSNASQGTVAAQMAESENFTVSDQRITKTKYFAETGVKSWFLGNGAVSHWSDKEVDGTAKQIRAADVKLVLKKFASEINSNAKNPNRVVTVMEDLVAAGTAGYAFDKETFPNIFKAADGLTLEFEELQKKIESDKVRRPRKNASAKKEKQITHVAPDALIGLNVQEIADQLKATFSTK